MTSRTADAPGRRRLFGQDQGLAHDRGQADRFPGPAREFPEKALAQEEVRGLRPTTVSPSTRVPRRSTAEVAANDAQCEEWVKLFAIDAIQADLVKPGILATADGRVLKDQRQAGARYPLFR